MLQVRKRNGNLEDVSFDKVTNRIKYLVNGELRDGTCIGKALNIDYGIIARDVIGSIVNGIETSTLDDYAARLCAGRVIENHNYSLLAGRISVSNHQKNTIRSFFDTTKLLYENKDRDGSPSPLLSKSYYKTVMHNSIQLEEIINHTRDYDIDYFGFKTLEKSYLLKRKESIISVKERPQHMYLRVAVALHGNNLEKVKETYELTSRGFFTHASPTMFNAGTKTPQLSSCFLLGMNDSMDADGGIPDCWKSCAKISKRAGGIGVNISTIRGSGSRIRGTNGDSSGIVPMLKVFDDIATYVDQGSRRKGSFAVYIEPWHPDILDFLELKKNHGKEEKRARNLFYALWIPDLFMKRLDIALNDRSKKVLWSLMCPDASHIKGRKRLYDCYGEEFEKLYTEYEEKQLYIKQLDILTVWDSIRSSQKETGTPYMLYKDHINRKNNQKNIGVIRNSNLCAEIVEVSRPDESAVCNLASIALPKFVETSNTEVSYNYHNLYEVSKVAMKNLNRVITINFYPTIETKRSNMRHRPVGLGVQGLADVFILMNTPFGSDKSKDINKKIFETIYFATMTASMEMSKEREDGMIRLKELYTGGHVVFNDKDCMNASIASSVGQGSDLEKEIQELISNYNPIKAELDRLTHLGSYSTYLGSPLSEGKFQFDLWEEYSDFAGVDSELGWDWEGLRKNILKYGVRNSLTTAVMPTASTAQILGNNECIEPFKYNLFTRRVLSGEFVLINKHLQHKLTKIGMWNKHMTDELVKHRGSIQLIKGIPKHIKELFKTSFEVKKKSILELSRDRGPFIDQTQSLNIYVSNPTDKILNSIHMTGWKMGLKTGMYYLRRESISNPIQFTVNENAEEYAEDEDDCVACGA
jgi:ribonucleoside-diphosphate reductase alpha subunit